MDRESGRVMATFNIRPLDPTRYDELLLVALRMRQTLVSVLGQQRGLSLYSMEWLTDRVRWHLDPTKTTAVVLIAEDDTEGMLGHAIARIEHDQQGNPFGYFSTIFVEPASRRRRVASALVERVLSWFALRKLPRAVYNTASHNHKVIGLLKQHGFDIGLSEGEMVQLTKPLVDFA